MEFKSRIPVIFISLFISTNLFASGYVGFSAGSVDYGADAISTFDDPTGIEILLGSEINKNLNVEISYIDFGEAEDGLPPVWRLSGSSITFGALAKAPLNETFDVFLKVGLHRWDAEFTEDGFGLLAEDDGTDIFYGVGALISVNETIGVGARYNSYDFDGDDVKMFSLNAIFGF